MGSDGHGVLEVRRDRRNEWRDAGDRDPTERPFGEFADKRSTRLNHEADVGLKWKCTAVTARHEVAMVCTDSRVRPVLCNVFLHHYTR